MAQEPVVAQQVEFEMMQVKSAYGILWGVNSKIPIVTAKCSSWKAVRDHFHDELKKPGNAGKSYLLSWSGGSREEIPAGICIGGLELLRIKGRHVWGHQGGIGLCYDLSSTEDEHLLLLHIWDEQPPF